MCEQRRLRSPTMHTDALDTDVTELRLAELLAALSTATDLAQGHPVEEAMRGCLPATWLARELRLSDSEVSDVYYTTLLKYAGCTAMAHEEAVLFGGNDNAARAQGAPVDFGNQKEAFAFLLFRFVRDAGPLERARILARVLARGSGLDPQIKTAHCEVAAQMARRLELSGEVQQALYQIYERWAGGGPPQGLRGEQIALAARLAQVAIQAVIFNRLGGPEMAVRVIERRAGTVLDPTIAAEFVRRGRVLLGQLDTADIWTAVLEVEPEPRLHRAVEDLDDAANAFGDFVDLKSPSFRGHSSRVAALVADAGRRLGWSGDQVTTVRRAALLHDLGRTSVPNGIWDKPGPLTVTEWEQVRLHPYHTERILARSPVLAALAPVAGAHHERQDGSGYYRQLKGSESPPGANVLAAADVYEALTHERPHRAACSEEEAARLLRNETKAGKFEGEAVEAVLAVAGHPTVPVLRAWPAQLSDREVEVLRLLARGSSTRAIAATLVISPKTADHHIQHIYNKIGVSTRASAALFAMEHNLLP